MKGTPRVTACVAYKPQQQRTWAGDEAVEGGMLECDVTCHSLCRSSSEKHPKATFAHLEADFQKKRMWKNEDVVSNQGRKVEVK